jgi:acetate kinase
MLILVLNCGSSSVKFQVFDSDTEAVRASGLVDRVGTSNAIISYRRQGAEPYKLVREMASHEAAIACVLENLTGKERGVIASVAGSAGGHRVVHGGGSSPGGADRRGGEARHRNCIEKPLHNPANLKGIQVCEKTMPGGGCRPSRPSTTLPKRAYLYGIPISLNRKCIRRYGFRRRTSSWREGHQLLGRPLESLRSSPATSATARRWPPSTAGARSTPRWASPRSRASSWAPAPATSTRRSSSS